MLDLLDDALEPWRAARWGAGDVGKRDDPIATAATPRRKVAQRTRANELANPLRRIRYEFHVVGHSAGSIFAPLVQYLTTRPFKGARWYGPGGLGLGIASATLWAPAIRPRCSRRCGYPLSSRSPRFAVYTLADNTENDDDCASIYQSRCCTIGLEPSRIRCAFPLQLHRTASRFSACRSSSCRRTLKRLFVSSGAADWVWRQIRSQWPRSARRRRKHHRRLRRRPGGRAVDPCARARPQDQGGALAVVSQVRIWNRGPRQDIQMQDHALDEIILVQLKTRRHSRVFQ